MNYINTARKYMGGKNEETLCKAVKGIRDKVFIATKVLSESRTKAEIIRDVNVWEKSSNSFTKLNVNAVSSTLFSTF